MANPDQVKTSTGRASMLQIHTAIDHLYAGDYECAIVLASAAEGILPRTDKPHTFRKIQALAKSLPSNNGEANGANDVINWLKHGNGPDGKRTEQATISKLEVIATITRAISKFIAVHQFQTPKMVEFADTAIAHLSIKNTLE